MRKKLWIIFVILFAILGGKYFLFSGGASISQSHIEGNVPEENNFDKLLHRDIELYFTKLFKYKVIIKYEFLREGPTQTGIAYPKYYLWVKIWNGKELIKEGAIRIAAVEKTHFDITNFVSKDEIINGSINIYEIFPKPVCEKIKQYL